MIAALKDANRNAAIINIYVYTKCEFFMKQILTITNSCKSKSYTFVPGMLIS